MPSNNSQSKATVWIIAVVALIIVGVFVVWYISTPSGVTPADTQTNQSSAIPTDQTQGATQTGGNTKTTPSGSAVDIAAQYAAMFSKFGAQKVTFSRANSTSGLYGDVYTLYAKEISDYRAKHTKQTDYSIGIAEMDLSGDGVPEALVYEDLPSWCGSAGCLLSIYQKQKSGWQLIFQGYAFDTVGVLSSKTQGFSDLLITLPGDITVDAAMVRFEWNGSTYAPAKAVAAWDGTMFRTAR